MSSFYVHSILATLTFLIMACDDSQIPISDAGDGGDHRDADWSDADDERDGGDEGDADDDPTSDTDEDGLPDAFEQAAGNVDLLDWRMPDTDDDGVYDGDEDPDGDGLTNLEEYALTRIPSIPARPGLDPMRLDLLIELDAMTDRRVRGAVLAVVVDAYDAAPIVSATGARGIGIHFYRDQEGIEPFVLDGSFPQRYQLLSTHPPTFSDTDDPPIPYQKMVHVMIVTSRRDDIFRGGDTIGDRDHDSIENTGVLIYWDTLEELNPQCGVPDDPRQPPITFDEALAATMTHEIGHTLQLGHDTDAGGSINYWNIMSVPDACSNAQMRFHGVGNDDEALGNTEELMAPRFSVGAAELMEFTNIVSVHTATFEDGDNGHEM